MLIFYAEFLHATFFQFLQYECFMRAEVRGGSKEVFDKLLRENYNQYFLLGICPSRLFRTFNEANILLIVYFDNMFDLQSQKLQLESV